MTCPRRTIDRIGLISLMIINKFGQLIDASFRPIFSTSFEDRRKDRQTYHPVEIQFYISVMFPGLPDDVQMKKNLHFCNFEKKALQTDGPTDGQTILQRCEDASKNIYIYIYNFCFCRKSEFGNNHFWLIRQRAVFMSSTNLMPPRSFLHLKFSILGIFYKIVTKSITDGLKDRPTDTPSYRDARAKKLVTRFQTRSVDPDKPDRIPRNKAHTANDAS